MKIVLVDDHPIILESLSLLLKSMNGIDDLILFDDPENALDYILTEDLDILITDYEMPQMNGCTLTLKARKSKPDLNVLMLTVSESIDTIRSAFHAGILGYVMKKAGKKELQEAIETVSQGKRYYSKALLFELLNSSDEINSLISEQESLPCLTSREIEIIELIGLELSSQEMADKLFLSPATVEKHRHNIIKKLGVKNSIGVVKYAYQNNLISFESKKKDIFD